MLHPSNGHRWSHDPGLAHQLQELALDKGSPIKVAMTPGGG